MTTTQPLCLSVPLGKDAHAIAEQFAAEQATIQKGKHVYLNTLAVYAVHSYLKWLSVETDLTEGDSWHPGLRAIFDVADLVLPDIGKLECCWVLPGETAFVLPTEVTCDRPSGSAGRDRIGYVAVQFSQQLDSVQLLGFAPALATVQPQEEISIAELQSLDVLIDTIEQWKYAPTSVRSATSEPSTNDTAAVFGTSPIEPIKMPAINPETLLVNLRQWLEGMFNQDWQPTELVLASNLRSTTHLGGEAQTHSISRAKAIAPTQQGTPQAVVLVVQLTFTGTDVVDIRLRLYPGDDSIHLPPGVQLILLDEVGTACMEAQARSTDDWMQLEFSCQHEERFSVRVKLGEMSITEQFVV